MRANPVGLYDTWYNFKSELQRRSGVTIINELWFQLKPAAPLPWPETHMQEALKKLSRRIQRLSVCPRCGGSLVLDRDMDGYFKHCIVCSFSVAFEVPEAIKDKPAPRTNFTGCAVNKVLVRSN